MRTSGALLGSIAVVVAAGCGGDRSPDPDPSAERASPQQAAEAAAAATAAGHGDGAVIDAVRVDGHFLRVTCARPDEGHVREPLVLDEPDPRFDRAARLTTEPPHVAVALHAAGRVEACPDAAWVLALGGVEVTDEETAREEGRRLCLVPAVPDDERCAEGGPFWYGTDPTQDGTAGDGRSAVWVEGRITEPAWRTDPLEVVARDVVPQTIADFYLLQRVGLRLISANDALVVVEVVYQNVMENGGDLLGTEQREHHTLGRLRGRQGWYESEFIVDDYGNDDLGRDALDERWSDGIARVLVEVDRQ